MEQVSIRLTDQQIEQIDKLAKINGITRSEQVREGLEKYLGLCDKVDQGNFILVLPQIEAEHLYHAKDKLEDIKEFIGDQERDPLIMPYVEKLMDALTYDCGIRLVEQKPDELIDLGGVYGTCDWVEEAIQEQQEQIKHGVTPKYIYKK